MADGAGRRQRFTNRRSRPHRLLPETGGAVLWAEETPEPIAASGCRVAIRRAARQRANHGVEPLGVSLRRAAEAGAVARHAGTVARNWYRCQP